MTVRTRSPGKGWSGVAPYSNYTNTVANYAAALAMAMQTKKNTDIENKILDYKNGVLSYDELVAFLNTRLAAESPGSTAELNIRNVLLDVENYERKQQVDLVRAKLTAKYAKNGISASEQVQIEEAVLEKLKEGSTEYTQQLGVISTAREIQRVEEGNAKVAKLQSELSKGGLDTGEQIQVYKEMAKYTEAGSQERSDIESKIGALGEQKRKEDQEIEMNQKLSQMLDQYKGGGISTDEALAMNRMMQQYVDPGSPEEVSLKQQEANLLGDVAGGSGGGSGGSGASGDASFKQEIAMQGAQLKELEAKFAEGRINPEEFVKQQEGILSLIAPQDIPQGAVNAQDMFELKKRFEEFEAMKQAVQSGQAVPVKVGNQQVIVPLSELTSFKYSEEVPITDPTTGAASTGRVVTLVGPDGTAKMFSVNDDGTFSEVTSSKSQSLDANYNTVTTTTYTKSPNSVSPMDILGTVKKPGPTTSLSTAMKSFTPSTVDISKNAADFIQKQQANVSNKIGTTLNQAKSTFGNILSSPTVKSIAPTAKSVVNTASTFLNKQVEAGKSTASNIFGQVKTAASNLWGGFTSLFK